MLLKKSFSTVKHARLNSLLNRPILVDVKIMGHTNVRMSQGHIFWLQTFPLNSSPAPFPFLHRLAAIDDALQIRRWMEAVFRCEPAADRRFPPVFDGAWKPPVAGDVLTPASNDNDANAAGDAACEKLPRRKLPAPPRKERRNKQGLDQRWIRRESTPGSNSLHLYGMHRPKNLE